MLRASYKSARALRVAKPPAAAAAKSNIARGVEQAPDDDDDHLRATQAALRYEGKDEHRSISEKKKMRPEIIEDEDGPARATQLAAQYEATRGDDIITKKRLAIIEEDCAPVPVAQQTMANDMVDRAAKMANKNDAAERERHQIMQTAHAGKITHEDNAARDNAARAQHEDSTPGISQTSTVSLQQHAIPQVPTDSSLFPATDVTHNQGLPDGLQDQATLDASQSAQTDAPSESSYPILEATLVEDEIAAPEQPIYDAVAIPVQDNDESKDIEAPERPCWKRHRRIFLVGSVSLVIGALGATVGTLVSDNKNNKQDNSLSATANPKFYANSESKRCDNVPLHQPSINLGKKLYDTLEECCDEAFWNLHDNECLMNSLALTTAPTISTTDNKTTTFPTFTSDQATSHNAEQTTSFIWKQQGQTIFGEATGDRSGYSVALSGDGKTLAVGASGEHDSKNIDIEGYVKVYHWEDIGSLWKQQGGTILGEIIGDFFGWDVALSSDGKIVAIGAPGWGDNKHIPGYVQVYYLDVDGTGMIWKQLGQTIQGKSIGDEAGISVSLSADGRILAIGADANDNNGDDSGLVGVYHIDGSGSSSSNWEQLGQDIVGEAAHDYSGFTVSLSADGNVLAIGADGNDANGEYSGHVRVYNMEGNETNWKQLGQDFEGDEAGDLFGHTTVLSANGQTLAVGATGGYSATNRPGHVMIYHIMEDGLSWKQLGNTIFGKKVDDQSGTFVSMSADGNTVAIGANANGDNEVGTGHAGVYFMADNGSSWNQLGQEIDGNQSSKSGLSVALSADGKVLVVGSPDNNGNGIHSGHVRVFQLCSSFGDGVCP